MKSSEEKVVDGLIIDVLIINPIEKILRGLKDHEYGERDIHYLNEKLKLYTEMACKLLDIHNADLHDEDCVMNDYVRTRYIKRFTTLYNFFKSIDK